jgi:hypothetical protein
MHRPLLLVPLLLAVTACGHTADGSPPGGPVTPSSIPISIGPSAHTIGNTMPTGIVIQGTELVLYFWDSASGPVFAQAWRNTGTGAVETSGGFCTGGTGSEDQHLLSGLSQCRAADRSLVEFGVFQGEAARITSRADGTTTEAHFARWNRDTLTVFWLQRHGKPAPTDIFYPDRGLTSPLPADQYPVITVYDGKGEVLASGHIRPGLGEQKGG